MNKKSMQKWVRNLRSGKFKQADGILVQFDGNEKPIGHCCLGVLGSCNNVTNEEMRGQDLLGHWQDKCEISSEDGTPMDKNGNPVAIKIRFRKEGKEKQTREFDSLATANDSGVSFKSIAKWIEKNYKLL